MKEINILLDSKDYDPKWPVFKRTSARGIMILPSGKMIMNYIGRGDYYSFPGGGVEPGEDYEEAVVREVKEETGYNVIPGTLKYYGKVLVRKSNASFNQKDVTFEGLSVYYTCKADPTPGYRELTDSEKRRGFKTVIISPSEAYAHNKLALLRSTTWTDPSKLHEVEFIKREQEILRNLI